MNTTLISDQFTGPEKAHALVSEKGSLERSANITFVVAFLALLAVSILSARSLLEVRADADQRSRTHEIISQTKQVLYAAIDLQNRLRGYVITQDTKLLNAYSAARDTVITEVARLHDMTADNPSLQRYVPHLESLVKQRIEYAEQLVAIRQNQGFEAAKKFVVQGYGQRMTDQIRVVLKDMNTEEQQLLAERTRQIKASAQYTLLVILGLGGLAIIILGWSTLHIRQNIAQRRQAEHERDRLFNYALDIYCVANFDGYFTQVNPAWTHLLGWTAAEMQATPYLEFVHPDDREATTHVAGTLRDGKELFLFDNRYRGKDGSYKWISWVAYPLIEEKLIFAVGRDVTEKKLAEEKLGKAMALQRAILDNAAYAIISTTPDGIITTFNQAAERMLGYTAAEVVGLQSPAILHDPSEVVARAQELSAEFGVMVEPGFEVFVAKARYNLPAEYEWTYIRKDGIRLPVLLSVTALRNANGEITGFLGMAADISRRKQAERERDRMFNYSLDIYGIANFNGYFIQVNPAWEQTLGWKAAELLARPYLEFVHPDDRDATTNTAGELVDGKIIYFFDNRYVCKDGTYKWLSWVAYPLAEEGLIFAVGRDITERKRVDAALREAHDEMETRVRERTSELATLNETLRQEALHRQQAAEELRASEQRVRLATEATEVGIWEWNVINNNIHWDAQMFLIYGIPQTANGLVEYSQWSTAVCPEELSQQEQILQETVRQCGHSIREFRIRRQGEEEYRLIRAVETVRTNAQGQAEWVVGTNQDITEHRRIEAALQQSHDELESKVIERTTQLSAKNEELKGFAYTVSHDLKAPLRGITGYAQELERRHKEGMAERAQFCITQIITASKNLDSLIEDLLKYSRLDTDTPTL
ncbi:MAG: PAS domain S-box protein, partial [Gallionellaceae bacterium]|nr:PAS domain S-box protein [Gallionellaceae bacterium]